MPIKQDDITNLSDAEIEQVARWCQDEKRIRAERRKAEAIARIKELAASVGVAVAIEGRRGRPATNKPGGSEPRGAPANRKEAFHGR